MAIYKLNINGQSYSTDVADDTPLLWVLRDHIGLTGTKYGCGISACGACTVHVDGQATKSCMLAVSLVGNAQITTIEGLSKNGDHPVQKAWDEIDVPQCGYCQAGQIMTASAFLKRNPHPTDNEIVQAMNGHICRCGTYHRIKDAVRKASQSAQ